MFEFQVLGAAVLYRGSNEALRGRHFGPIRCKDKESRTKSANSTRPENFSAGAKLPEMDRSFKITETGSGPSVYRKHRDHHSQVEACPIAPYILHCYSVVQWTSFYLLTT